MKTQLFILILIWQEVTFANVNIAGDDLLPKKSVKKCTEKKKMPRIIKKETKLVEIEGYADAKYVRFVVDIINNKIVTGRMMGKDGAGESVHGEIVNGVLYLNVSNGGQYTVVIPK